MSSEPYYTLRGRIPVSIPRGDTQMRMALAPRLGVNGILLIPQLARTNTGPGTMLDTVMIVNRRDLVVVAYFIATRFVTLGMARERMGNLVPALWKDLVDEDRYLIKEQLRARSIPTIGMGYQDEAYTALEEVAKL